MQVYQIGAASDGQSVVLGTTDTASDALKKLRLALDQYDRAWVIDCAGADISIAELMARAGTESGIGS